MESESQAFWYVQHLLQLMCYQTGIWPDLERDTWEESFLWQDEFLIAGGKNVDHALNNHFSLTQPSVTVARKAQESMSCYLAACYSITPLSIQTKLELYWATTIRIVTEKKKKKMEPGKQK